MFFVMSYICIQYPIEFAICFVELPKFVLFVIDDINNSLAIYVTYFPYPPV